MVNTTSSFLLFLFISFAATTFGQDVKAHKDSPVKFEVLSVRLASPEERQSDNIGMDVIVRFRLSNKGRMTTYFYTDWKGYIIPEGYTIRSLNDRIEWYVGLEQISNKSPGIKKLMTSGDGGEWLALTSGMAIEFELFDSTARTRGKHAQTFFAKVGEKNVISEVYSDFYEVPTKTP
jgi:hypothetical protein